MFKRKSVLISALIIAVVAVVSYLKRGDISLSLMERVAVKRLSTDFIAELPDGLHIALCGAGSPIPDPKRSGPCVIVIAGQTIVAIDAGTGGARNLGVMQIPVGKIDTLFLTHFHSDHIDGLGEIAMQRWVNAANNNSLPVVGPTGVTKVVDGFNQAYALDALYRNAHHGDSVAPLSGGGMSAIEVQAPLQGEQTSVFDKNGLTVNMFTVEHEPISPAVGYRFDYKGRSIVVSGDTSKSSNLERMAKGVDLLVHEALATDMVATMTSAAKQAGNDIVEKITLDIIDYHTTPVEAAQIAATAQVGHLLYYHIVPALLVPGMEAAFLKGVADAYQGPVTVGVDGTMISLPADNDEIELSQLL